ncbi:unnamed protein product [Dicrocoelium dendriticum]|nr:unnamed protein product [Dicrocoelium dendriticum]
MSCNFICYLRPAKTPSEVQRAQEFTSSSNVTLRILDCIIHSAEYPAANTAVPVSTICMSHYTGLLIHVILKLDLHNETGTRGESRAVTLSENVGVAVAEVMRSHEASEDRPTARLYFTLDLPLFELRSSDFLGMKLWLRYLSIDGAYLQFIDIDFLHTLTLDYFVLDGCNRVGHRLEEAPRPLTLTGSQPRECVVIWNYLCSNATSLYLWADMKTQWSYCGNLQTRTRNQSASTHFRSRTVRSAIRRQHRSGAMERKFIYPDTFLQLQRQWLLTSQLYMEKLTRESERYEVVVRSNVTWYQSTIVVIILVLSFVTLPLSCTVLFMWILLSKRTFGKLKMV